MDNVVGVLVVLVGVAAEFAETIFYCFGGDVGFHVEFDGFHFGCVEFE